MSFLVPTLRISKPSWQANWLELEKKRFRNIARWLFISTAIGYVLHFVLIDLPLGKSPIEVWIAYRFGLTAFSLFGLALTFHEGFSSSRFYKVPVLVAGFLFSIMQAQAMVWHPATPYFYAFLLPCLTTVMARMDLLKSLGYLGLIHAVQVPTLLATGLETHLIVSAITMSLGAATVFRSNMISDVNAFLSEQLKDEIQHKLNDALKTTKHKEKALAESNRQLVRKNLVFQTLLESSTNLPHFQDVRELLEYAIDQFEELFQDCGVMMILSDQGTHRFGEAVYTNIAEDTQQLMANNYRKLLNDEFLNSLKLSVFNDESGHHYPVESLISLPMISSADKVVGTALFIGVQMGPEAVETISLFLALVTSCAENLALTKRLEHLAHTDNLTSVYNRNYFEREIRRHIRTNTEYPDLHFSVLLVDVNGLKTVNDYYGHKEGDNLIVKVANLLKTTCRRTDVVCRLGGDEFVIICPETKDASKLLYRIRNRESSMRLHFHTEAGQEIEMPVSVSVGLASTCQFSPDGILRAADELMYEDKRKHYQLHQLKRSS
ncbi:diguanylate cyclase (GGDEF) domain-containing protein [Pseudobacteriovorax antillogorgiicola]|uniref:diguanylate cyclase n=1 Tax=Pseudobacteriovorax antillogorgiicola TaxID=1513793 RepID=A0A1Y6CKA2_9BACT|nr:diguanylate cyclase (GGDEF)-like protein [Pseudobacteriovorax antillogorgiicola]SMF68921.1 diguanylate cyclase (GGDEF) domain-containing protein [Pseudobacteriovorax antillogorgiicola]